VKNVFLCTPCKLGNLNLELIERIKKMGFKVSCAMTDTPQKMSYEKIFENNINLIKSADIFVAVLKDYGKDLTAEVGMAFAWGVPTLGLDYNANKDDVMSYYA
jgi:nucleoside 2-deoxyribosyltransferase